jgi:bacillithiol system protein YtxJ
MPLVPLSTLEEMDVALAQSAIRPILIFKHSPVCGTSAEAYDEVEALLDGPPLSADAYLVDVWAHRAVSRAIAERLATRHESPQALLVESGRVVWSASHYRVTAEAIDRALSELAEASPANT